MPTPGDCEELKHALASNELYTMKLLYTNFTVNSSSKDKKIVKLKEEINQLVSARQETLTELQELRFAVSVLILLQFQFSFCCSTRTLLY